MLDQIQCLVTACQRLKLKYSFFDDNQNCLEINLKTKILYFVNSTTSFNHEAHAQIAEDKYFSYKLCQSVINMPKTVAYIDPFTLPEYQQYVTHRSYQSISQDILKNNSLPMIVKRNRGSRGNNVFLCKSKQEVKQAVKLIFNQSSKNYDYVVLAQQYISIKHEFRAVVFNQKVLLLYEKDISQATFDGNLSPLHWKNATAIWIKSPKLTKQIETFLQPFFSKLPLKFAGFDVAIDDKEQLYLIEANTRPGLSYFIKAYGQAPIVKLYQQILAEASHD